MKKTVRKHLLQFGLLIALIAFAFWFALKDDMKEVLLNIRHVSPLYLMLVIAMGILYYLIQGYLLTVIGRKYMPELSLRDGMENAYVAAFFNGVTPLGGGQVAQTYAFHKLRMSFADIASILWKDFFMYQIVVVLLACIILTVSFSYSLTNFPKIIWLVYIGLLINASVILILWTMSSFPTVYKKISGCLITFLHRIHVVKNMDLTKEKWNIQVQHFSQEVQKLKEDKVLILKGLLLNLLRQIIYYSIPYVVGMGLGLPLSLTDYFTVVLLSCFIHMLNALTPLPGDTGWTESAFIIIFGFVFQRVYASSIMILWRMATYYVSILIGGIVFMVIKTRKKEVVQNIAE